MRSPSNFPRGASPCSRQDEEKIQDEPRRSIGGRVRLRAVSSADHAAVFAGMSNPLVIKYYGLSYDTYESCQEQMDWFASILREGTGEWLVIERNEDEAFLGCIGYHDLDREHRQAEMGYWLQPEYWGKGYATEAIRLFYNHVFASTDIHRLWAEVEVPNEASWRLLDRCGFTFEGTARDSEFKDGQFISLRNYSRLRTDPPLGDEAGQHK